MTKLLLLATLFISSPTYAQTQKGTLPELRLNQTTDQDAEEKKQLTSELMISKTEDKALESLQKLLKRNKGSSQEPDLLYRLAELYMRKSKTGRFFDLNQDSKTLKLSSFPIPPQKGKDWIKKASTVYSDIENRFPKFSEMDSVLFNNAFACQQLRELKKSEVLYKKLLDQHPNSSLIPDGLIALGELLYDQGRFKEAVSSFSNIERFKESKVYSYGLYKWAWTLYNLKQSDEAIDKLSEVIQKNPLKFQQTKSYDLRKEALRDMVLFVGDTIKANELYSFFKKLTNEEELGEAMSLTAKLYESYSREKEIHIFLNEFIQKEKNHPFQVRAHMILVTANETLKKRDDVLQNLEKAGQLCETNSIWKAKLEPTWADTTCVGDFRRTSLEIAKKWWDIWLKNKAHVEFSKLTEKSLRLVLKSDDPLKPDFKTRYALAELLFQQNQFDDASVEYEKVGQTSTDTTMTHDANYAALFSAQKLIDKNKTPERQLRIKNLSLNYIQKHPTGVHSLPVQLQLAISEYEANNDKQSEEYLKPLLAQKKSKEIKLKAQDLMLDILNFRKDFTNLKIQSSLFLKESENPERSKNLQKIYEEAHYSEVQRTLTTQPKIQVAEQLIEFRKTHPKSALSKEALWQAVSLSFTDGFTQKGADLSMDFASQYPTDKRAIDAVRESANSYLLMGKIDLALKAYEQLLKTNPADKKALKDLTVELHLLEGDKAIARKMILDSIKAASSTEKKLLQEKYLNSFTTPAEKSSPEYKKFIDGLVSQGLEPYATQYWTDIAREQFEKKQFSQSFSSATKAMSRDSALSERATARYIQAQILEQEFTAQSVKASQEDRLSIVLNIKTEKLDKALTAYNSAAKMTTDPELSVQILEGLDRCYGHFVSALSTMPLPASLSEADQKTLRSEIEKLTTPIQEKQAENRSSITEIAKKSLTTQKKSVNWADLSVQEVAPVDFGYISSQQIDFFIPDEWSAKSYSSLKKSKFNCESKKSDLAEWYGHCFLNQYSKFENEALALTDTPTNRAWGLFYLSLVSERKKLNTKSYWLIEKAIQLDPTNDVFKYQKVRILSQIEGFSSVASDLVVLFNSQQLSSPDLKALQAVHLSQQGDWKKALDVLDDLDSKTILKHQLTFLLAEAQAKTGDNSSAVSTYKKALSSSQEPEQRQWIEKKLDYLKTLKQ